MDSEKKHEDINRTITSSAYILPNLHNFLPDSVFLDQNYNILAISSEVSSRLGYRPEELSGRPVSVLGHSPGLIELIRTKLSTGYFANEKLALTKKCGGVVDFDVSGFYLAILSSCSDMIVLRFNHRTEIEDLRLRLNQTRAQIDNFIYRTAHDLRGPLATIQGLIYLLAIRTDDSEVNHFTSQINTQCKKLEERLTNLVYLAKVEEEFDAPTFEFKLSELGIALQKVIEHNRAVEITLVGPQEMICGYNEELIKSVLTNVVLYIVSLKAILNSTIRVEVAQSKQGLVISVMARGFEKDTGIEQVLVESEGSPYVDVLQSSKFTYLYAAQKIAVRLKAFLQFRLINQHTQQITVTIPQPDNHH